MDQDDYEDGHYPGNVSILALIPTSSAISKLTPRESVHMHTCDSDFVCNEAWTILFLKSEKCFQFECNYGQIS